jgi:hypothetical protein
LPSDAIVEAYDLTILSDGDTVTVSETTIGSRLPSRCPGLHVVGDGAFCLGRGADRVSSPLEAARFWKRLGDFLYHQFVAARRRAWPSGKWLSHGHPAADAQLEAEVIAERNGWVEDYANAIENDEGWIAGAVKRGVGPPRTIGCPCASTHPGRACPKRRAVEKIVAAERRRRNAEAEHFEILYAAGVRCCGRINGCPLEGRE